MSAIQKTEEQVLTVPASAAQHRLWFLYQLNPDDTSYNIPQAYRLSGTLDIEVLTSSLNQIIDRHSVLRTTFAVRDHLPIQQIHDTLPITVDLVELSRDEGEVLDDSIQRSIDEEVRRPFNLERGPLIRAVVFQLSDDECVLLIIEHHIVFDRTSEGLLLRELSTIYNRLIKSEAVADAELPEVSVQYSDYTKWRSDRNQDEALAPQLDYWRKKLDGVRPLELPTDFPRSKGVSTRGERLYFSLPPDAVEDIEKLSRQHGATMFMGLLAVFKVLMHQWTGSNDITVGTPFADRRLNGTKELLGFFVNNIILRTDVPGDAEFPELLSNVRKVCFGAYRHNSVPFEKLVEHLRPDRHENRNPLFDVQFAYQKLHPTPLNLDSVESELLTAAKGTSQYDLTFTVREQPGGYDARIEYRTDLFSEETMTRLLHRFQDLICLIGDQPNVKLSEIPLLDDTEYRRVTESWNQTVFDYPRDSNIQTLFEAQARRTPDALAVTSGAESISYRDLDRDANRLANFLLGQGFGKEQIAAICVERSIEMIVGLLAILKAGGAYLPLDRSYPNNRLSHMLDDSGASILLTNADLLDELPDTDARKVLFDVDAHKIEDAGDDAPDLTVGPENLAYVIYTSGSTGLPKGVQIEHRNVVNFLCTMREKPGMDADDVLLAVTTLSFDIAVLEIFLPLIVGARTVIASHEVVINGAQMQQLLVDEKVTMMQATPVTWRMLIDAGWQGGPSFRVLCGGEAMPRELAQELIARSDDVWNMYGPTETTVWSSCHRIEDGDAPILIGRPIANTTIFILDPEMRPVPVGRTGELYIGGDGVTRGYLHRAELTAERFVPDPFSDAPNARLYRTGDGVRYLPDGNIEYITRLDNQVKVRGNRIELGEIQAAVVAADEVRQAVVIVREDDPGDARIAAYFVLEADAALSSNDIRSRLRDSLPAYMIPQYFIELDALPQTPNGKIDRNALPAPDLDALALTDGYRAPRSDAEKLLAAIWEELLGVESVGIHDNFVEMGGHSLLALQAISRIKEELGVNVSAMAMIMDTLEQIAAQFSDEGPIAESGNSNVPQANTAEPFYFGPDDTLFGLHHKPPHDLGNDTCILLCGPVYVESITAHWALKRLADQLARVGFHVLRFDYFGNGDSMGESEEGNVDRWLTDITSAAEKIMDLSGCEQVSLVGLRFGATLATLSGLENLKDVVLWDPIVSGEDYMTYMRSQHRSMIAACDARRVDPVTEGPNELLGFFCSPAAQDTIEASTIAASGEAKVQRVTMITHEKSAELDQLETSIAANCLSLVRHEIDDARCEISAKGRLTAFLPGASLRIITSLFSEQSS